MMMRLSMLQQPPVQQQILRTPGAFPPPAQMTLWPVPIMRRFRLVPASPQGKDFSVPYMKLLYTLFPAAGEFTIIPQPPRGHGPSRPPRISRNVEPGPTREEADNQIRKRIHDLSSHCPLPVFHAVSAFGTRLCFYRGQAISPLRMQPPPHPESAMLDVMDEQGASVLKTIITEIKAACLGL
ncbi:hypothetical protein A0H81_01902 [Grifola frondosa]|uniref:Uncharacterized protein n=1 Tax=Grifola frondosa TaxID=5627 RepID=A0A1C7MMZ4_GRIFR|nr:hypothetical protein A0H81_01902 [Grifola frondosa]